MEPRDTPSGRDYSIRAVLRVCDVLDLIQENPEGFSLTRVAEVIDVPKSSAYRYLTTLESRRYVIRDPLSGMYRIGPAFLPLQSAQLTMLADQVRPHLVRLRDQFGETLNLGILDGYRITYVECVESPHNVRLATHSGERDYLHCTALGKAVAATLADDRVIAILHAEGMPRRTAATLASAETYLAELETVRGQGYAVDNLENDPDGRCVAVPLHGIGLPTAISLSAPATRLPVDRVPEVASALNDAARRLAKEIAGSLN